MPPKTSASSRSKPYEQQTVGINGGLAALALTLIFYVLYYFVSIPVPPLPTLLDRLIYTLRLQSFSCLCVVVGILMVSLTRFFTIAIDPINGRGEHIVAVRVRFLTNTVEQFIISFVGQLILATYLTEAQMKVIPILVSFFVFGRIAFYIGYSASYLKRTVGYMSTFGPSFIVWWFVMYFVITDFIL